MRHMYNPYQMDLKIIGSKCQTNQIITKLKMKKMNKIYGLNIDMLRLCYEIKEPNNINILRTREIGEEVDFLYFYLRRIEGKHLNLYMKSVTMIRH